MDMRARVRRRPDGRAPSFPTRQADAYWLSKLQPYAKDPHREPLTDGARARPRRAARPRRRARGRRPCFAGCAAARRPPVLCPLRPRQVALTNASDAATETTVVVRPALDGWFALEPDHIVLQVGALN